MDDSKDHSRVSWTALIAIRPAVKAAIAKRAKEELIPMSHLIGTALDEFVTARSTA